MKGFKHPRAQRSRENGKKGGGAKLKPTIRKEMLK
jgi:hypothetical protein